MFVFSKKQKTDDELIDNSSKADNKKSQKEEIKNKKAKQNLSNLPKYKMTAQDKEDIFKFLVPIFATILFVVIIVLVKKVILGPDKQKIIEQNAQITQLKTDYDLKNNQYKDLIAQSQTFDEYDYYKGENVEDDKIAADYFSHLCSWSDSESYEALRKEMFDKDYTSENSIMKTFLPEPVKYYNEETSDYVYDIDINKDNLKFERLISYPIAGNEESKEYSAIIEVSSVDMSEGGNNKEYFGYIYVNYKIENGEITDASAETLVRK